jgi:hypothetical protein
VAAAAAAPPPPPAAATAAPLSAGVSQQQPHSGALGDAQNRNPERSISGTAAAMQQLDLDAASARTAASSPTTEPPGQQSADDWMMCPLTKVGGSFWSSIREARFCGVLQQDHVVSDVQQGHVVDCHAGGHGGPCHVQRWPYIQPCCHHSMAGCEWRCVAAKQPAPGSL